MSFVPFSYSLIVPLSNCPIVHCVLLKSFCQPARAGGVKCADLKHTCLPLEREREGERRLSFVLSSRCHGFFFLFSFIFMKDKSLFMGKLAAPLKGSEEEREREREWRVRGYRICPLCELQSRNQWSATDKCASVLWRRGVSYSDASMGSLSFSSFWGAWR